MADLPAQDTDDTPGDFTEAELTRKVEAILAQIDSWEELNWNADATFEERLRHFNGGALVVREREDGEEEDVLAANFNTGRPGLLKLTKQRMQTYHSTLGIFEAKVIDSRSSAWRPGFELVLNEQISDMFKSDMRLQGPYQSVVEDDNICGRGVFWFKERTQIIPKRGRILTHPDNPSCQMDDGFADWAFKDSVTAGELFRISRSNSNPVIKSQAKKLLKGMVDRNTDPSKPDANWTFPEERWESFDSELEVTGAGRKVLNTAIPVYYYFEKDLSESRMKRPVSVYCVARHGVDLNIQCDKETREVSSEPQRDAYAQQGLIFYDVDAFKTCRGCLCMASTGAQIGGERKIKRIKGQGDIMYDADVRIQKMLNGEIDRMERESMLLYYEVTPGEGKKLEEFTSRPLVSGAMLPFGLGMQERRSGEKSPNNVLNMVAVLTSFIADHTATDMGHNKPGDEENFKAQVLERLQDKAMAQNITESAWTNSLDMLAERVGYLLFDAPGLTDADEAHYFREEIIRRLKDAGHDVKAADLKGAIRMKARRVPGSGDMAVALARADQKIVIAREVSPEAYQKALWEKMCLVNNNDVTETEKMIGSPAGGPPPEGMDVHEAQTDMAMILASGVLVPPQPGDQPDIHTAVQMTVLERTFGAYQQDGGWIPESKRKFDAALAHATMDVHRIGDEDRKKAALKRIGQIAQAAGQLPVIPLGQPPVDPVKQAEIQLKAQEAQRKIQKDVDAKEQRAVAQEFRERSHADMIALQTNQTIDAQARANREQTGKQASRQLNDALSLHKARQEAMAPAGADDAGEE